MKISEMEEQDKLEQLISYLKSKGFEGKIFEDTLRKEHERFNAFMHLDHYIGFGDDLVRYKLNLVYDRQFNAYRLDNYEVFYRDPVDIDHKLINGIDTKELELLMSKADWSTYFYQEMYNIPTDQNLSEVIQQLWALSDENNPDPEGLEIQSTLIYKYWPAGNWNDEANALQDLYETKQIFKAEHLGIVDATLAFNIVNGQFDNLYELISKTGIEEYPGMDLKGQLTVYLSKSVDDFNISISSQEDDGIIDFQIPVHNEAGQYRAELMELSFTHFPDIKHGVFNGIDTANLEEQMKLIDWTNGELYYFDEVEDVILYPYVQTIKDKIDQLNSDMHTRSIAEYLQVKFWGDSVMEMYVDEKTWQMKDWKRTRQRFSLAEDTTTVSNLMQGRPVHSAILSISEMPHKGWCVIDPTAVTKNGLNPIKHIAGITRAQIETMVSMLPVDGTIWIGDIVRSIQQGEKVQLNINGINGRQQIIVSIPTNPAEERLEVTTPEGSPIPFNFRIDPDWTSNEINMLKERNIKQATTGVSAAVNKKPKGIGHRK